VVGSIVAVVTVDLDAVRTAVAMLPDVKEGTWYGSPAFRVAGKVFVRIHENDDDLLLIKVGEAERDALVAIEPDRFTKTEHRSERLDSVLLRYSEGVSASELRELVEEAWLNIAPRRVLQRHGRQGKGMR
jgi:hypothetical protein